jgi:poly(3-hydroxybutyrate) depolymerase
MIYAAYDVRRALTEPVYAMAAAQTAVLRQLPDWLPGVRASLGVSEVVSTLKLSHGRPRWGIDTVPVDGTLVGVTEEVVTSTPFGSLLRFAKPTAHAQPRVLIVPGLAGHFATLVRATVRTFLSDHDVFVADWHNARDIPVDAGRFGVDEYIEHLIGFMNAIGPGAHIVAVCQPCPAALAAAALMATDNDPAEPQSIVLMSGPVDTRINPGPVNEFATGQSIEKLERRVITTVSWPHPGAGRRVYPGFLQVAGFMGMDPRRHLDALARLARDIARGNDVDAQRTKSFYEEYFAVLDVTAEFYLETARAMFIDHDLPKGRLHWQGRRVDLARIETALMTVEAENDDICPPGQTQAAHTLCTGIPDSRKRHYLQPGVGHYGVFSGNRFATEIYPQIRSFIAEMEPARAAA